MLTFILKALLGKMPSYISRLLTFYSCKTHDTRRAAKGMILDVPKVKSFGEAAFSYYAPKIWNDLQDTVTLKVLPSVGIFKNILRTALRETCKC